MHHDDFDANEALAWDARRFTPLAPAPKAYPWPKQRYEDVPEQWPALEGLETNE